MLVSSISAMMISVIFKGVFMPRMVAADHGGGQPRHAGGRRQKAGGRRQKGRK